ncbi:MAG: sensor histidine kinase [Caulobacteraceae bacterium]|nr:sensor histidine kinase [Caulobacteraceae bacterium]
MSEIRPAAGEDESHSPPGSPTRASAVERGGAAEVARLEEAIAARDEFISVIAHELRNPMTPMLMQVDALRRRAAACEDQLPRGIVVGLERLEVIVQHSMRRATMLLDVSRLTSGMFAPETASVNLGELLMGVAGRLAPLARRARSPIQLEVAADVVGLWDPVALDEIADNLISNAIKYGGGRPIDVVLSRDGGNAFIRVVDRGIGISEDNKARIFDRFERAVTRTQKTGFGVGLWVVGQLVKAMDGEITVDSKPDEGSVFTVRLPLQSGAKA